MFSVPASLLVSVWSFFLVRFLQEKKAGWIIVYSHFNENENAIARPNCLAGKGKHDLH